MATFRKVVISSVVLCMVMFSPYAEAAITCGQVASSLGPCLGYLQNRSPTLPPPCCAGIRGLSLAAKTPPDRQAICACLKRFGGSNINVYRASNLPAQCGVRVPVPISPKTDCNTIR